MPEETVVPFDKGRKRRFTKKTAGSQDYDVLSFRAPVGEIRRVDEILGSGTDPELRTRSDVMNDALHWWLEQYLDEHSQEVPRTHDLFVMDHQKWILSHRQEEITTMTEMLEQAIRDGHHSMLNIILFNGYRLKSELEQDQYGSPAQIKKCDEIIEKTRRAMP
jgi:hypothetical protein